MIELRAGTRLLLCMSRAKTGKTITYIACVCVHGIRI